MKKQSATEQNRKLKKLLKAYKGLASRQQSIVQVLSVVFTGTARSYLVNCLRKLKIRTPDGKAFALKTLDPFIGELAASDVIQINDNYTIACNRMLAEHVSRELFAQGRFNAVARVVQQYHPLKKAWDGTFYPRDYNQFVREIRIGVYCVDADYVQRMFSEHTDRFQHAIRKMHPYEIIFGDHPDAKWLAANLPGSLVADVLKPALKSAAIRLAPVDPETISMMQNFAKQSDQSDHPIDVLLAEHLLLDGGLKQANRLLSNIETTESFALKGFCAFLAGSDQDAISHYKTALKLLRKTTQKRKIYFKTLSGLFFILALIRTGTTKHLQSAQIYAGIAKEDDTNRFQDAYRSLYRLIELKTAVTSTDEDINTHWHKDGESDAFVTFFKALCLFWANRMGERKAKNALKVLQKKAEQNGYGWIAAQSAELLSRLSKNDKTYKKKATAFWNKTGIKSVTDLVKIDPKWKRTIDALICLKKPEPFEAEAENSSRLVWLLGFSEKYEHWNISPREQRKNAKGVWSKGRRIALKRLYYERNTFDFLTPQDMDVCSFLYEDSYIWHGYPEVSYYFNTGAIIALVGHPLVFWEDCPTVQVEIAAGAPELLVDKPVQGKIKISLSHDISAENDIKLVKESPTRIKVIEIRDDVKNLAQILGKGVTVPETAREQVFKVINNVSSIVTVHSQMEGDVSGVEEIAADPTSNIHLLPHGQGLKIVGLVRPFSTGGPYFHPGEGAETVISEIDGKRMLARRDLAKETEIANQVVSGCTALLTSEAYFRGEWEWELDNPEDCLEAVLEFQSRADEIVIAWPEGEHFRIKQRVDINRFFMGIQKQKDWFSVSGELKLDDGLVLDMAHLLELMEKSPGRFVRLADGQFLALTRTFQKRLEALKTWSEKSGKNRRFHPLAALPLDDLTDELGGFRSDKHWKAHLKQLKNARDLKPKVPSTFKAELRDYQVHGFNWLARLSHWGVGACLADDMGLGKTIQALAVLLKAASNGPSLVVAPTSLLMNWEAEARRFAPTLNVVFFKNGNRDDILAGLKPFDMLVVSYGLLQQEKTADMLTGVHFQTIVLDEAQAIKNFTTKRSRAAMNLNGTFKLITTGTPLENHLGELWNLFRFINPGLLGSFARFNQNYTVPIEKYGDRKARAQLKKLVQPFILRRTKNQVLEELPERTDIVLNVELSKQEIAFYEALRRRAMQKLEEGGENRNKQMRVLAEIMKLRRACCNTQLVMPDQQLPSAKLAVFGDLLDELLANQHKALVFSQFVDHLHIIREFVKKRGLGYQYLDGSTTQKKRQKCVEAFQAGEGELFLISLKAGGLGLNLTAADYVIHMDPWWNPAVEDQASDRAHRIGQKRPVTVYRLVAKHTIEEKIVELHHKKRALADDLLDGAEMSGKMSADELLRLIRHA